MRPAPALFDPRTALFRPDLAEQALEGLSPAAAYRPLEAWRGHDAVSDVFAGPQADAPRISQLLHGEAFDVLDRRNGRLWGRCRRDGVTGWVAESALRPGVRLPAFWVSGADAALPFGSLVDDAGEGVSDGRLTPIGVFLNDPVDAAERLLGVRHAVGGRSSVETDCAGLVQLALQACGRAAPRYADEQARLGAAVSREQARRGDLAVWLHAEGGPGWTGHSALMLDEARVIHATGASGAVVVEPWDVAAERYAAQGFAASVIRRLT